MHLPPVDLRIYPQITMSYGSISVGGRSHPSSPAASPDSPDFSSVQRHVHQALRSSRASVQQVERLQAGLHRIYLLSIADGSRLVLKCRPPCNTRLLRHEQQSLEAEARVLDLVKVNAMYLPLPTRLMYDPEGSGIGAPFLLRSYLPGTPLSHPALRLSTAERARIDATLGAHLGSLSALRAPAFGPFCRVLAGTGSSTWREAFLSLLESVLRDAEDMLVSIPYDGIRYCVAQQAHLLDQVTEARLVALDAGLPRNVLVDERSRQVCGLLGFGNVVWGDPAMAGVFAGASEAFYEGFGQMPARSGGERVRMLIYAVHRAVVAVVTHYYRPQSDDEELEARRSLTWALNQLAAV
ncbi:hypothetical protein H2201_003867 [Coniosporium apollinis]|uniref:Aminoglycoside phosphotransferase domain-containing protein n=1 Tax=Coniosporium apollinis TaxID=61459 RepID=A0ABQ9NU98_9PEZI|nr:hypothetical protein H2201_003867 [Coniosporium apollinis]